MLFHVSEESGIERFEPRAPEGGPPSVWAIDARRLRNYLLPHECPRVTYYAGSETTAADVESFLGASPAVVAIESGWLSRLRACRLYCYHLSPETFECIDECAGYFVKCIDECAGYFVSRVPVAPARVEVFDDPMAELFRRGAELQLVPSLWPLHDAVAASSLQFSLIRMRNARSRDAA